MILIAPNGPTYPPTSGATMSVNSINVLFLCTHNSARSIFCGSDAESHRRRPLQGVFRWQRPGDQQQPHPLALQTLANAGIVTESFRSKNWNEFATKDAPHKDLVIAVCDNAAGEVCPNWPGQPATAHGCKPTGPRAMATRRTSARPFARRGTPHVAGWGCWSTCRRPVSSG